MPDRCAGAWREHGLRCGTTAALTRALTDRTLAKGGRVRIDLRVTFRPRGHQPNRGLQASVDFVVRFTQAGRGNGPGDNNPGDNMASRRRQSGRHPAGHRHSSGAVAPLAGRRAARRRPRRSSTSTTARSTLMRRTTTRPRRRTGRIRGAPRARRGARVSARSPRAPTGRTTSRSRASRSRPAQLDLKVNGQDSITGYTSLNITGMVPGNSVAAVLTINNAGTVPFTYTATSAATDPDGKALRNALTVKVTSNATRDRYLPEPRRAATRPSPGRAASLNGGPGHRRSAPSSAGSQREALHPGDPAEQRR